MATKEQYQEWLSEAEAARHKLALGDKVTQASYYGRSVTYTQTNVDALDKYIDRLKSLINGRPKARRPFF